jgi:hypothetical protein
VETNEQHQNISKYIVRKNSIWSGDKKKLLSSVDHLIEHLR